MPLQFIPALDWVNSSLTYNATYNWDRGANVASIELEQGNIIKNQRQFDWQGSFNLQSLYNKNKYLKKINQKFMASSCKRSSTGEKEERGETRERDPIEPG